ncbi:receptor-like protein kinase FERONIA [Rhododendron vialii]|uniref:receptor-like protein kinase FERONIA n=1 Tax=Rhododendron vialii TaxID=182163 RepID=UPI00265E3789|nr:receptor-like protein kinase FERONIA [Rhododendron vialii]
MFPYLLSIAVPLYFFLLQSTLTLAINSPGLYSQQLDHVAVNCGSSSASTAKDTRKWTGDTSSDYITSLYSSKSKLISLKATNQPLPYDPIPYATARLSHWPFTYTFRVTPGQKLIRLHFYPASYRGGFKRSEAFFTVKAGPYTLLSNFSASLAVDALGLPSLVKEYCVNVDEDQPLIITFSPSRIGNSDEVYAFVNGIEIISMPAALYHTHEGNPAAKIIGKSDRCTIDKSIALEKVHRLNVGGSSISSIEDTGMFRDWYEDSNYLLEKSSVEPVTTTIRIKYTSIPPYTAPQKVYQTSWSLVPDKQANKTESNFTWRLPVDLGFRYLLRLHFCELEYEIKESGRMEFSIFVNEQVAEAKGDLIKWSGGNGVAVYKDYVVMMEGDRMEGKRDLLIALRPHNHGWTEPIDATIKGVEVFKLSNHDKNLAGVNPVLLARASTSPKSKKLVFASRENIIATGVVILLTVLNIIFYQLRSLGENSVGRTLSSSTSEGLCRHFSFAELLSATNNFNDELVIGSGGFGKVYKALIDDGATMVALKRCNLKSQGAKEFWTEIEMLSKLRHTHLVSLLGYCDERDEMILVYEFMEHGTLADHLYKVKTKGNGTVGHMSWEQRLNICIGAAQGLDYLHTGIRYGIIHRDVKSTNILLDKDWTAKISDFGLCKLGSTSHSQSYVSTLVKGSFGYFDPEYFLTCKLRKKSDVYAFGVVMLEMLCGRAAVDTRVDEEQCSLVLWAKQGIKENKLDQLLDHRLRDEISPHCLKVFVEIANSCLDSHPKRRPTMADVVVRLQCLLALENQCMVPSTEEEEEDDFSVGGDVDEQFGENTKRDDSLPRGDAPSSSTLALNSKNTHGQKRSKGKVSKVFQRSIEFLAKGVDTKRKKRNVYDSSGERPVSSHSSTHLRSQWKNVTLQLRRFTVGSNIPRNFSSSAASGGNLKGQILPSSNLRIFTFSELRTATKNFRNERMLGEGGFGRVYRGLLDEKNGRGLVFAVKKLMAGSMQGFREWQAELNFLGSLSHPNLVKLLGYCWEEDELLLVYEFIPKGSLENHLFGRGSAVQPLPWGIRLNILIGAARGLEFLHTSEVKVIYRDFKTSNILLDESYNAKLSDFGLAKSGPSEDATHVSTRIMGTQGYAAPEYVATGHLTTKSDVYGFGVVLVEMLTGLPVHDRSRPHAKQNLVDWAKPYLLHKRKLINIMDSRLEGKYPPKAAFQIAQVALECLVLKPKTRPSMTAIVETLEHIGASNGKPMEPVQH